MAALRLGYGPLYDYAPGKMDWLSYGLAHEGNGVLAGDEMQRGVPTCDLDETVAAVRDRLGSDSGSCVAVNHDGVVMGVVDQEALASRPGARVEEVMTFGVTTVRPSEDAEALRTRMLQAKVEAVLITSSDGRLLGVFRAGDPGEDHE